MSIASFPKACYIRCNMKTRTFFLICVVAPKPQRWVHDLMLKAESDDHQITTAQVEQLVVQFLNNGDNPLWLRELRGDIFPDYCRETNSEDVASETKPVHEESGVRIFAPIRGFKETVG